MTEFFRFPHTPHLAWLAQGAPREDKVLSRREASDLLSHEIRVEEKVDGANLGLSVDEDGALRAQNRGKYIDLARAAGQFRPLSRWLAPRTRALVDALGRDLILFGEWCYAVHSVRYTRLPDWFLAFDVYDREAGLFWSTDRRDAMTGSVNVAVVPPVARGRFALADLIALLGRSRLGADAAEGLYLRRDEGARCVARAKLVRKEFTQSIGEHWSRRALATNELDPKVIRI